MRKGERTGTVDVREVQERYKAGDSDWFEHLDPTPVEVPTRLRLPQRQVDRVREIVRREMSMQAAADGYETFAEADDFELEDGEEWSSPYEEVFEPAPEKEPAVVATPEERSKQSSGRASPGRESGQPDQGAQEEVSGERGAGT